MSTSIGGGLIIKVTTLMLEYGRYPLPSDLPVHQDAGHSLNERPDPTAHSGALKIAFVDGLKPNFMLP